MSFGKEYMDEHAFEIDYPFGFAGDEWETQDGRKIPLTEMTEQHIRNCMKLVSGAGGGWYEAFEEELKRRKAKSTKDAVIEALKGCKNTAGSLKEGSMAKALEDTLNKVIKALEDGE